TQLWRNLPNPPRGPGGVGRLHLHRGFFARFCGLGPTLPHEFTPEVIRTYTDRFRDPVTARAATDTYRTFLLREVPASRRPERRRATVPIRALFGTDDGAIHRDLAAAETANADDYTVEYVPGCGHFIPEERPDLVRSRLLDLAAATTADRFENESGSGNA
uniref:alpha/beta fold hydrolase n=1 Tax=Nocardia wallacei TaxID=480035 RepID=UPI00245905D1